MPDEIDYDKLAKLTYVGWQFDCPVCHGTQEISDHDPQLLSKIVCLYCKNELTVFQKYLKIDLSKETATPPAYAWVFVEYPDDTFYEPGFGGLFDNLELAKEQVLALPEMKIISETPERIEFVGHVEGALIKVKINSFWE